MKHINDVVSRGAMRLETIITLMDAQCVEVLRVTLRGEQLVIRVKECDACHRWIKEGVAHELGTVASNTTVSKCWGMDLPGCRIVWTKGIY
ncbi:hypothetical protein [Klebsiella oxytoca]|uniref:hypothetical protein n=1 Tax=Klebsiella oxytoca TaxID=571 RepID=UPI003F7F0A6E